MRVVPEACGLKLRLSLNHRDVVSELNNTAKAQDLNATLKSQDLSLPLRRARRPSSINALMSLQAKSARISLYDIINCVRTSYSRYNTLEQQHDEAKEKNDELKDQLQDAKNGKIIQHF